MKRYLVEENTPLKYHKFCRWVSLPLSIVLNLVTVFTMLGTAELNWGHTVDLTYNALAVILALVAFIGFFRWTHASWYAVMGIQVCTIIYSFAVLVITALYSPDETASALGGLLGSGIVSVLIMVYYTKRRALFFREMVPKQPESGFDATSALFCRKCGQQMSAGSRFCCHCGADSREESTPEPAAPEKKKSSRKWVVLVVFAVLILIGILCAVLIAPTDSSESQAGSPEQAAESVLYLEMYDKDGELIGTASGFLVEDGRTLVTNYHVVEDAWEIYACTPNEEEWTTASILLAYDEVADLAVLRCDTPLECQPLVLADSDGVKQGQMVYAVGYSLGIANTMSNGIVSARYEDEYGVDTIQTTAAISQGNSGGPLVNGDGHVVGVVCAYYVDGQNLNVAVAANTLNSLLEQEDEMIPLHEWAGRFDSAGYADTHQQAAYDLLFAWVEENYTDAWDDGTVSYGEYSTDEENGTTYSMDVWLYGEDELVLRCAAMDEEDLDIVYVTLYPDGKTHPVEYAYYDSHEAEETAIYGWADLYAPDLGQDGAVRFYDYDADAESYMTDTDFANYLDSCEWVAEVLCEMAVFFGDYVLCDLASDGIYSMADFGFVS